MLIGWAQTKSAHKKVLMVVFGLKMSDSKILQRERQQQQYTPVATGCFVEGEIPLTVVNLKKKKGGKI
jgi:hypothetical protein